MASSRLVLPAPLAPRTRLIRGPGTRSRGCRLRTPATVSRVSRMTGPRWRRRVAPIRVLQNDFARPGPGEVQVPRGTRLPASETQWHHHVAATLAGGLAHQGGRVGIAKLQHYLLIAQCRQCIEQVVDVEAHRQAVDLGF